MDALEKEKGDVLPRLIFILVTSGRVSGAFRFCTERGERREKKIPQRKRKRIRIKVSLSASDKL